MSIRRPDPASALLGLAISLVAIAACTHGGMDQVERPNIVLIVADDLGVEGLRSYGGEAWDTPHLDKLAANGARFEFAFATPICTPSRAELLTGQYPFRTGWIGINGGEDDSAELAPSLPSLGRLLQKAGYATAVAGKWQIGRLNHMPDHPHQLGFDEYSLWNMTDQGRRSRYWEPSIIENGKVRDDLKRDDVYGPDVFSDFLIDFIERNRRKPFFVFYPMVLVHQPYTVTPDTLRDPKANVGKNLTTGHKKLMATRNAPNVAYMDKLIGRLVDTLDRLDLRRRTILIFTADNGTSPLVASSRQGERVVGGKGKMNDRGSSVPLIVNGPGVQPGSVRLELVDFTDLFPTIAELAQVPLPGGQTLDGRSFAPLMRGEEGNPRPWVYVQRAQTWFIRDDRWRLHEDGQLYDVTDRFSGRRIEPPLQGEAAAAHQRLSRELLALRPDLREIPRPSGEPRRVWQ